MQRLKFQWQYGNNILMLDRYNQFSVTIVYQEASSSCKTNWMIAMVLNHIGGLAGGGWHQV
ncbi:hypothetical protein DERF_000839 [Dermatophagoides farinae]|uniref:Uncharacterized protein n=1 Tax=Dermatophagoides farinae TaxID=6954 RepID=A0A922L346_DERFA|nr:hypothetical protein DERF_011488 [Dermatophagoides farinae]KAH9511379.1 hypothetical protein DERF_009846 [Dermatophagoides farinae]KAH9526777.1 hypothetical protein DERF_000839 [Dermatophagoides farinae]